MTTEIIFLIIGLIGGLLLNYFTHFTADPLLYRIEFRGGEAKEHRRRQKSQLRKPKAE